MNVLKSGITLAAASLALGVEGGVQAATFVHDSVTSAHAPSSGAMASVMRQYSSPDEAIDAFEAAGHGAFLNRTLASLSADTMNPSAHAFDSGWYAAIGSGCCLVVLNATASEAEVAELSPSERAMTVRDLLTSTDAKSGAGRYMTPSAGSWHKV